MTLAEEIRALRKTRRYSQIELAERTGLNRITFIRWEKGVSLPRRTELTAVLRELDADDALVRRLLLVWEKESGQEVARIAHQRGIPMVHRGDYLRILRQRRGMTQLALAQAVGVPRVTLCKWETGDAIPSTERLHTLLFVLGADEAALLALTSPADEETIPPAETLDSIRADVIALETHPHFAALDLHYLALILRSQRLGWKSETRELTAHLTLQFAEYLMVQGRWNEIKRPLDTVAKLLKMEGQTDPLLRSKLIRLSTAYTRKKAGAASLPKSIGALQAVLSQFDAVLPLTERAEVLSCMAFLLCEAGRKEEAIEYSIKAVECARRVEIAEEWDRRYRDHVGILHETGHFGKALDALEKFPRHTPLYAVQFEWTHGEILRDLGSRNEASVAFTAGQNLALVSGMTGYAEHLGNLHASL